MVSFVPAFASALYACVLLYFADEPRPAYLILGALALAATIQTHLTAVLLLLPVGVVGLVRLRRIKFGRASPTFRSRAKGSPDRRT